MPVFLCPFSPAYWKAAAKELKSTRMLVFAALITALRVAVKSLSIPIAENLFITIGFLPNALGSLVYGPILALLSGMVSDLLGVLLFPKGAFFPPFTLVEMMGSFLFAIFLYRAKLSFWRVALSKFSVNLVCNLMLTPLFLSWMNGKAATFLSLPRIIKNGAMLPLEVSLLMVTLGAIVPVLAAMGLPIPGKRVKRMALWDYALLGLLFALSIGAILWYIGYLGG